MAEVDRMVEAARIVLDGMLADAETLGALVDRKHIDHDDMRQAVLGQYQMMADYSTDQPEPLALVRADLAAAERRVTALREILISNRETQA